MSDTPATPGTETTKEAPAPAKTEEQPTTPPADKPAEPAEKPADPPAATKKTDDDSTLLGEAKTAVPIELKFPDGVEVDEAVLGEFKTLAEKAGLTSETAQPIADLYAKAVANRDAAAQSYWAKTTTDWVQELKTDKDFGGKDFEKNLALARKPISKFGDQEFKTLLDSTRMGNNPALVKFLWKIGKSISEDTYASGAPGGRQRSSAEALQTLYPTMNQEK